jgi:hypothetical protein
VHLEAALRPGGSHPRPQRLEQVVHRNHVVRVEQEEDEERPLLRAVETQRLVPLDDLQRAEEPEVGAQEQATTLLLNACVEQALTASADDSDAATGLPCTADTEGSWRYEERSCSPGPSPWGREHAMHETTLKGAE